MHNFNKVCNFLYVKEKNEDCKKIPNEKYIPSNLKCMCSLIGLRKEDQVQIELRRIITTIHSYLPETSSVDKVPFLFIDDFFKAGIFLQYFFVSHMYVINWETVSLKDDKLINCLFDIIVDFQATSENHFRLLFLTS